MCQHGDLLKRRKKPKQVKYEYDNTLESVETSQIKIPRLQLNPSSRAFLAPTADEHDENPLVSSRKDLDPSPPKNNKVVKLLDRHSETILKYITT